MIYVSLRLSNLLGVLLHALDRLRGARAVLVAIRLDLFNVSATMYLPDQSRAIS